MKQEPIFYNPEVELFDADKQEPIFYTEVELFDVDEKESQFKSPVLEPGKFLSLESVYEDMGIPHQNELVKSEYEFVGWYIDNDGKTTFGNKHEFAEVDSFRSKIMYDSNDYISRMRRLSKQWVV